MGTPDNLRMDEMVFYTASSHKKALSLIKKVKTSKWSYWEIQVQEMNTPNWPENVKGYYKRDGKRMKNHPDFMKFEKKFLKHLNKYPR